MLQVDSAHQNEPDDIITKKIQLQYNDVLQEN